VQKLDDKRIYRIFDANLNRAKEGLRVCEDICRFYFNDKSATRKFKVIRHEITGVVEKFKIKDLVGSRNIMGDVSKQTTDSELKRKEIKDVFFANVQRCKESIRVLEELAKLLHKPSALCLKKCRYSIYGLEKKIITKF